MKSLSRYIIESETSADNEKKVKVDLGYFSDSADKVKSIERLCQDNNVNIEVNGKIVTLHLTAANADGATAVCNELKGYKDGSDKFNNAVSEISNFLAETNKGKTEEEKPAETDSPEWGAVDDTDPITHDAKTTIDNEEE